MFTEGGVITRLNDEQFSSLSFLQLSPDPVMVRSALETQSAWSWSRGQLDPAMVDWEGDSGKHRKQHISTRLWGETW